MSDIIIDAIRATEKGAINGVSTLDSNGKIPSTQFPYVEFWTLYASPFVSSWEVIEITPALANSRIEMTICNNTNNFTFGVREVGSSLVRTCQALAKNSNSIIIKTDGSKQIEVFTDDIADTQFIFSAQL